MTVRVIVGNCLDVMPSLGLSSVDAIVTDPPYAIGFMGKTWDRVGVPGPLVWASALTVIKPGGYLLAFGGTRTFHRLGVAIEDGGWEIHDCLSWLYGSGFPKHRSKLKPAWEPIIVARRPAETATSLNIDDCRIGEDIGVWIGKPSPGYRDTDRKGLQSREPGGRPTVGRWPANVILDEEAAEQLDEQTGELTSGANPSRRGSNKFATCYGDFAGQTDCEPARGADRGGASRFYYCAKASRAEREAGLVGRETKPLNWSSGTQSPGTFQSAGTKREVQNHHPTVKPLSLMRWLCRLVTPAGGSVLDPFMGSGTTGMACVAEGFSFVGIEEKAEYAAIAEARIGSVQP